MKAKFHISPVTKICVIVSALLAMGIIGIDQWQKFQHRTADYTPWTFVSVENGDRFIVSRHNETKDIQLCGVSAQGEIAAQYLETVINQGNGTVVFEQAGSTYEAWTSFEPDYDAELFEKSLSKVEKGSEINIHLNTWMIEQGYAVQDSQNSQHCHEPKHLASAENLAKERKIGIWQDK